MSQMVWASEINVRENTSKQNRRIEDERGKDKDQTKNKMERSSEEEIEEIGFDRERIEEDRVVATLEVMKRLSECPDSSNWSDIKICIYFKVYFPDKQLRKST